MWQQTLITLRAKPRGFHLVTDELLAGLPELKACRVGLLHLWLQHTSASLTINENADPAVRRDFERFQLAGAARACRVRTQRRRSG